MATTHAITGVLLAGGRSRRMGYDKRGIDIGGIPLLEHIVCEMSEMCSDTMVIANDPEYFSSMGVRVLEDIYPGSSLGGLYTGVYHASTEHVFVSACDMAFFNRGVARVIMQSASGYDVTGVRTMSGYETLFACYSKRCLPFMQHKLEQHRYRIQELFEHVQPDLRVRTIEYAEVEHIEGADAAFLNINRPEDLALAIEISGERPAKEM